MVRETNSRNNETETKTMTKTTKTTTTTNVDSDWRARIVKECEAGTLYMDKAIFAFTCSESEYRAAVAWRTESN